MVLEEDLVNAVLWAAGDEYARKILASTLSSGKSVEDISVETGIPVSTCYRRVHELLTLDLLKLEKIVITDTGKKHETFRSILKDAKISLTSTGELFVDITPTFREETPQSLWRSLKVGDKSYFNQYTIQAATPAEIYYDRKYLGRKRPKSQIR